METALRLAQWGDIAQFVIAIVGAIALIGAIWQIVLNRANARRVRVYEYADRFNRPGLRRRSSRYRNYVEKHTYSDFKRLTRTLQNELLILPNLLEEVAALYHRGLLDRDVAAEMLGVYVENLWASSKPFMSEMRAELGANAFCDWEEMQTETPGRKLTADRKRARRRALRKLFRRA
jgi:hypothetical protein